ncbi:MAG TPA: hypothetical protein VF247_08370 [Candidatus Krumholzibacteria bacterium]
MWFAAALLLLCIPTLDALFGARGIGVRAAALVPGLALAAWCLSRVPGPDGLEDRARYRWLFMLAGLHIVATLFFFPVQHLFDARPVVTADHAVHFAQCLRSKTVFWTTFRLDCYSPYFMAGYPAGTLFDLDMKGAELFTALIPIHTATALKLFILVAYLSMLPSVYRGARMLGFRLDEGVYGVMLLLAYWHWGRPYAGDFRFVGMFSFVFATHAVIYISGLVRRFLDGDRPTQLFILGPVVFLLHVLSAVMAVVPVAAVLVADRARLSRRRAEQLALWALVVLFVNALWILPLIRFLPFKTPTQAYFQLHGARSLARLLLEPAGLIALAVFVLAAAGAWRLWRQRRAGVAAPCALASLVMLVFATFGVYIPGVDQLEPGRFIFSAIVFATPLAGAGTAWLLDLAGRHARSRARVLRAAVMVALALAPVPLAMLDAKAYYHHTLTVDLPPRVERLRAEIVRTVHGDGRLMIEEGSVRAYDGIFLPSLLPSQTHVEQIGGPYPQVPLIFHRTTFDSASFLGRPFDQWRPDQLSARLRFLRVRWVVTATNPATAFVASIPGIVALWSEGPLHLWTLSGDRDGVPVRAGYNRIDVDIAGVTRPLVLPYHWIDGLETDPGNEIVPVLRDDDPVPFICIRRAAVTPVAIRY